MHMAGWWNMRKSRNVLPATAGIQKKRASANPGLAFLSHDQFSIEIDRMYSIPVSVILGRRVREF
jgi:hypothetical protein